MSLPIIIILSVIFMTTVVAIRCTILAPRLTILVRLLSVFFLIPVSLFFLFGFLASFEPGDNHIYFKVTYLFLFISSLLAIGRLIFIKKI